MPKASLTPVVVVLWYVVSIGLACVRIFGLICLFSCNSSVTLFYNPAVLFFFLLIARCSLVKTITEEALEHRGLNNKEN